MRIAFVSLNRYRPKFPPLGLAYLATILEKENPNRKIRIFDANFEDVHKEVIKFEPDVIGITAMTPDYGKAIRFAEKMKKTMPCPILVGGVHITTLPDSLKKCFDIGVLGEGEKTVSELIALFEKHHLNFPKNKLKNIKGILFHDDDKIINTGMRDLIKDLDTIPAPDRKFINKAYFEKMLWKGKLGTRSHIITSRGCPYNCSFCSTSLFWKRRIRMHSVPYLIKEIKEAYYKYGINYFDVQDDLFIFNKERAKELIKALEKERLLDKLSWFINLRVDLVNDELLKLMKKLNVIKVGFGFESGCDKTLKFLKSNTVTVDMARKAVDLCLKNGLEVGGSFIFAVPRESIKNMYETLDVIKEFKEKGVTDLSTFVLTPYPGTKVWEIAKARGVVSDDMNWDRLAQNETDNALNPMLLDPEIKMKDYKKFFRDRSKLMKSFKFQVIKTDMKKNFFWVLWKAIKRPKTTFKLLFKRTCYG